jgi:hypothetical protein
MARSLSRKFNRDDRLSRRLKESSRQEREKIMTTAMKTAIIASVLLLAIPAPAFAGCRGSNCGGGTDWGAAVGAGILGGVVGSALAPTPQQQIIVIVPSAPATPEVAPPIPPLPAQVALWCGARQYPAAKTCPEPWRIAAPRSHQAAFFLWYAHFQQWYPAVDSCPEGFLPSSSPQRPPTTPVLASPPPPPNIPGLAYPPPTEAQCNGSGCLDSFRGGIS